MEFLKIEDDSSDLPSLPPHGRARAAEKGADAEKNVLQMLARREKGIPRGVGGRRGGGPLLPLVPPPPAEDPDCPDEADGASPSVGFVLRSDVAGEVAEEHFLTKETVKLIPCQLKTVPTDPLGLGVQPHPAHPALLSAGTRSTFLMAFSPCKRLMASTHGDHALYVSRVSDGSCVRALNGHPRTPWCVAFHPSLEGVLASGCLGGQVRVWDLKGHSEVWQAQDAIASLSFHPVDELLAVATAHELHFWRWGDGGAPSMRICTASRKERVRYVRFDEVGHTLITGIANLTPHQIHRQERGRRERDRQFELARETERERQQLEQDIMATRSRLSSSIGGTASLTARRRGASDDIPASPADARADRFYRAMRALNDGESSGGNPPAPSASQTLSDLAQAATNQLMAETRSSRESSLERADASAAASAEADHPYFSRTWMVEAEERARRRSLDALRRIDTRRRFGLLGNEEEDGIAAEFERRRLTSMRARVMRERVRMIQAELDLVGGAATPPPSSALSAASSSPASSSFRHSPASEFQEVPGRTEVYRNPDPLARSASDSNARFQSQTSQRLRHLVSQREELASQIDQIGTTRSRVASQFDRMEPSPSDGGARSRSVASASSGILLDDWAIRRRSQVEERRAAADRDMARRRGAASAATATNTGDNNNDDDDDDDEEGGAVRESAAWREARQSATAVRDRDMRRELRARRAAERETFYSSAVAAGRACRRRPVTATEDPRAILNDLDSQARALRRESRALARRRTIATTADAAAATSATAPDSAVEGPTSAASGNNSSTRDRSRSCNRRHRRSSSSHANTLVATEQQEDGAENIVHVLPLQRSPTAAAAATTDDNDPVPSTSAEALAAGGAASRAGGSGSAAARTSDVEARQNMDIVLMSRHIEDMQQICRDSLSGLADTNQQHQLVRLQTIGSKLEDLQRTVGNLGASSSSLRSNQSQPEDQQQQQQASSSSRPPTILTGTAATPSPATSALLTLPGPRTVTIRANTSYRPASPNNGSSGQDPRLSQGPRPYYSRYALYPRHEFDLFATANSNFNSPYTLPSSGPGSSRLLHGHLPGARGRRSLASTGRSPPGVAARRRSARHHSHVRMRVEDAIVSSPPQSESPPPPPPRPSRSNSGRARRAATRMASQLRATFRALEMSPDLALASNNLLSQTRAEASRAVMIQQSGEAQRSGSGLRELSQRVGRLLRERRGTAEATGAEVVVDLGGGGEGGGGAAGGGSEHFEHNYSRSEEDALLDGIPRPGDPLERFDSRWRHFFDGIDHRTGERLPASNSSSSMSPSSANVVRPFALPRHNPLDPTMTAVDFLNLGTPGRRRRRLSGMSMEVASGYSDYSEVESDSSDQAARRWYRPYRASSSAANTTSRGTSTTSAAAGAANPEASSPPSSTGAVYSSPEEPRSTSSTAAAGTPTNSPPPARASPAAAAAAERGYSSGAAAMADSADRYHSALRRSREAYASIRERMDVRAGIRREVARELQRERRYASREAQAMALRRGVDDRYRRLREARDSSSATQNPSAGSGEPSPSTSRSQSPAPGGEEEGAGGSRYPYLTREILFRRLRRRNALDSSLMDGEPPPPIPLDHYVEASPRTGARGASDRRRSRGRSRERSQSPSSSYMPAAAAVNRSERFSRDREMLWMVNQLTIDQANMAASAAENNPSNNNGTGRRSIDARRRRYGYMRHLGGDLDIDVHGPPPPFMRAVGGAMGESMYFASNAQPQPTHRIQAWDFGSDSLPDLTNTTDRIVVTEARIHNDASVDISSDGELLVTLVPSNIPTSMLVGVYSLAKATLGECYATYCLESSAVSVSLSPTGRHLLVGLTTRAHTRISLSPSGQPGERSILGQVFRLRLPGEGRRPGARGRLVHKKDFAQAEHAQTALNCMRWVPISGEGIVYATNTGLLKMLK